MKSKILLASVLFGALSAFAADAANSNAAPNPYAPPANYAVPPHYSQGLPPKINQTIQQMYPGAFIVDADWEAYGYEIELSNHMELHFDTKGNLLGQKWDD